MICFDRTVESVTFDKAGCPGVCEKQEQILIICSRIAQVMHLLLFFIKHLLKQDGDVFQTS